MSLDRGRSPWDEVGQFPLADPLQRLVHLEKELDVAENSCNTVYLILL